MPTYRVKDPATGRTIKLSGDSPPTEQELEQVFSSMGGEPQQPAADQRSLGRKAWDALAIPEQMSREGLEMLAGMVPKPEPRGKRGTLEKVLSPLILGTTRPQDIPDHPLAQEGVIQDVLEGAPRALADTMAEAAPGFLSRASLLTAGLAKGASKLAPAAKTVMRAIGAQGEEMSGIAPKAAGALEAAYKDSSLMLSKGKKAASPLYEAGKAELDEGANLFQGMYKPEEIVDAAKSYMQKGGKLEPAEALMVRKAYDSLLKSGRYVKDSLFEGRAVADEAAKASGNIAGADAAFQRGLKADALRNVFPQNKYGGASGFKTALATALTQIPGGKVLTAPLFSPATQGAMATAAGIGVRQGLAPLTGNPALAAALAEVLQRRKQNAR